MANIFKQTNDVNNDVNRNTFDLSFQNNLTLKFGQLYPVFLKEGLPGSSFKINPSFALNFMPMVFPVQTRIRAYLHFFKVRKRSLWDGFMDYVSKNKASLKDSMPYLDLSNSDLFNNVCKTGSLGDYLGIPTTIVGNYSNMVNAPFASSLSGVYEQSYIGSLTQGSSFSKRNRNVMLPDPEKVYNSNSLSSSNLCYVFAYDITSLVNDSSLISEFDFSNFSQFLDYGSLPHSGDCSYFLVGKSITGSYKVVSDNLSEFYDYSDGDFDSNTVLNFTTPLDFSDALTYDKYYFVCSFPVNSLTLSPTILNGRPTMDCGVPFDYDNNLVLSSMVQTVDYVNPELNIDIPVYYSFTHEYTAPVFRVPNLDNSLSLKDLSYGDTPYYDSVNTPEGIKLNALPFRAYESIYNAFYRNILNDPFILDGSPEYNKYIPTSKGGADTTAYTFHSRYWEDDFLTTAIQNPQASDFPVVVGITNLNGAGVGLSVRDEEGNNYQLKATISDDGKSITKFDVTDLPSSQVINNPSAFIDLAQSGISITDFRCANALQRWLEMNARKGLRFKDIIKGRFDVDIRFDELNMPEFIGGDTADVSINQINQSVGSREGSFDDVLGSYAGQASCYKRSDNAITTFCDEPCYIIGLLSVVPVANYSQLLPKLFTKRDILDEFSPEFAHIGYQPIPYAEVCPTQAFKDPAIKLSDPFGYQRAWYDYIASTDEVHGQFRSSLRNFLVNRVFGSRPVLSHSFLTVNNDDINDIFSVTADTDKILGQVYFDCQVMHPIPKFGIPKLEA